MKSIPINFKKFDKNDPDCINNFYSYDDITYLVLIEEKTPWDPVRYVLDVARPFGGYIDDFWDTENDWVEGKKEWWHVVGYADLSDTEWSRNPMEPKKWKAKAIMLDDMPAFKIRCDCGCDYIVKTLADVKPVFCQKCGGYLEGFEVIE